MSASRQIPLLRPPFFTAPTTECPCWRLWDLKGATICSLATADWPASWFFSWRTLGWLSLIGGSAAKRSHAAFLATTSEVQCPAVALETEHPWAVHVLGDKTLRSQAFP